MTTLWSRPWKSPGFSWIQYGVGWAGTFVSFVLEVSILSALSSPGASFSVFLLGLLWGFIPALVVGYPLGLLIAGFLNRYPKLWQQVLGFFVGMTISTLLISQLFGPLWQHIENLNPQLIASALVGIAGAIGRLAAWYVPVTPRLPTERD